MSGQYSTKAINKMADELPEPLKEIVLSMAQVINSMKKKAVDTPWLNLDEAAAYIDKSPSHLRNRLKKKIGYSQPDRELSFHKDALDKYLMDHYHPPQE